MYCQFILLIVEPIKMDENNASAKHLAISNNIHRSTAQIPMHGRAEWHQPVVTSVLVARELEELEQDGGGRQRRKGRDRGRQQAGDTKAFLRKESCIVYTQCTLVPQDNVNFNLN